MRPSESNAPTWCRDLLTSITLEKKRTKEGAGNPDYTFRLCSWHRKILFPKIFTLNISFATVLALTSQLDLPPWISSLPSAFLQVRGRENILSEKIQWLSNTACPAANSTKSNHPDWCRSGRRETSPAGRLGECPCAKSMGWARCPQVAAGPCTSYLCSWMTTPQCQLENSAVGDCRSNST